MNWNGKHLLATSMCLAMLLGAGELRAETPQLFEIDSTDGHREAALNLDLGPTVASIEPIEVNVKALAGVPSQLSFKLPDGSTINATQQNFEVRTLWDYSWTGGVDGADDGAVDLTVRNGVVAGTIVAHGKTYEIRPGANGDHQLLEIDPLAMAPTGSDANPRSGGGASAIETRRSGLVGAAGDAAADPANRIDVMVVYTPDARRKANGHANIRARIQNAIDHGNRAFRQSNTGTRLHLVHAGQSPINGTNNARRDLRRLLNNHRIMTTLRNRYHADLISMVTARMSNFCGYGKIQISPGPGFASIAGNVVALGCLNRKFTMIHEFGHNLGLEHDFANRDSSRSRASYRWSYGYNHYNKYRTMMSYGTECGGPRHCPRRAYFSNPNVRHMGLKTGTSMANNARTIRKTKGIVANFRQSRRGTHNGSKLHGASRIRGIGGGWVGQAGVVSTNQTGRNQWHKVSFGKNYRNSIVIMGPVSHHGGQPVTTRLRAVRDGSFKFKLDEWEYLDGGHVSEDVSYLVMKNGWARLKDGTRVQSGKVRSDDHWKRVVFKNNYFKRRPVVLAQIQTTNGGNTSVVRVNNVSRRGFNLKIQEEEADGPHRTEVIGYVAIAQGQIDADTPIYANYSANRINHNAGPIWFGRKSSNAAVMAATQTYSGADSFDLRYNNPDQNSVDIFIEEEQSADEETAHTTEDLGFVVFDISVGAGGGSAGGDVASETVDDDSSSSEPTGMPALKSERPDDDHIDTPGAGHGDDNSSIPVAETVDGPSSTGGVSGSGMACSSTPLGRPVDGLAWIGLVGLGLIAVRRRRRS